MSKRKPDVNELWSDVELVNLIPPVKHNARLKKGQTD